METTLDSRRRKVAIGSSTPEFRVASLGKLMADAHPKAWYTPKFEAVVRFVLPFREKNKPFGFSEYSKVFSQVPPLAI